MGVTTHPGFSEAVNARNRLAAIVDPLAAGRSGRRIVLRPIDMGLPRTYHQILLVLATRPAIVLFGGAGFHHKDWTTRTSDALLERMRIEEDRLAGPLTG